ncbi:MAG: orotate phosphoribosyltransferase [Alphaproteobacteria bacterium]
MPATQPAPQDNDAGAKVARILLDIGAINFSPEDPFILTSGRASPVYIDCRRIISFPEARRTIIDLSIDALTRDAGPGAYDAIAGGETAGIPFAAWIADRLTLPMLYVRKQPKGFARMGQIEGVMEMDCRVLLVEDMATDGGSKLNFINAVRKAGGKIDRTFVVFYYDIFKQALERLGKEGVELTYLSTWWDVADEAERQGLWTPDALAQFRDYLADPDKWSAAHGGAETG